MIGDSSTGAGGVGSVAGQGLARLLSARLVLGESLETPDQAPAVNHGDPADLPAGFALPVSSRGPLALAVDASAVCLRGAGVEAATVERIFFASTYRQDYPFWSAAHALARETGAVHALPVGVSQMCNGAGAAIELAAALSASTLIATADVFPSPAFDRWNGDYGVVYGDAATAVFMTPSDAAVTGPQAVTSLLAARSVPLVELETMHRVSHAPQEPLDVRGGKRRFLAEHGSDALSGAVGSAVRQAMSDAVRDAGLTGADLHAVYLPRLLAKTRRELYEPAIAAVTTAPVMPSPPTGHLGAGDVIANLALVQDEVRRARPSAGTPAIHALVSAGAGFTVTVLVTSTWWEAPA